jgi:hypothetical protein
VDAPENARNAVIEHHKYKSFLGEDKLLTCCGNGTEGKIGVSKAPQKRLERENLIFFAA